VRGNPINYVDPTGTVRKNSFLHLVEGLNFSWCWSNLYKQFKTLKFVRKITTSLKLWTKALSTDPQKRDPKDAFSLLKDALNYVPPQVKFTGLDKALKQAIDTVQTAPGGVPAAERQRNAGTYNVGSKQQLPELENDPSFGCLYRCP
jgi:hypothetical protein